jgi:hypothetical protein
MGLWKHVWLFVRKEGIRNLILYVGTTAATAKWSRDFLKDLIVNKFPPFENLKFHYCDHKSLVTGPYAEPNVSSAHSSSLYFQRFPYSLL